MFRRHTPDAGRSRQATRLLLAIAVALLLLAGCSNDDDTDTSGASPEPGGASGTATATSGNPPQSPVSVIPQIVEKVQPSVVTVLAVAQDGGGEGSGVIWDDEGRIVTNQHVVEGAQSLQVVLVSGERLDATLLAADELTDLAVIEVQRRGLPPATFRDDLPVVGELAIAIGNPLGFESSVTAGIVSGLHRAIPSGGQTPALVDLMQTDAPISPGNSGGALVDSSGSVMGINVAYIPPEASAVSIGFSIPSPTVTTVVKQLIETGQVEHSYLGVEPRPLTAEIASQLGINTQEGVLIFDVPEGSAAAKAGVQPGDVLLEIDGTKVDSVEDLYTALREKKPGDQVTLKVLRDGQETTLTATLESRPSP
ncbi:MAG TPA: trypsin-like peptidase domain-containing protein, partial [Dehalococcoidia bacterium]